MFSKIQNIFGCMDGFGGCGCDNLLLFFVLLVAISCFCCGGNNGFSFDGCGCDGLLFFFLLLVLLFCQCGGHDECEC